jgi:hypothetical protein
LEAIREWGSNFGFRIADFEFKSKELGIRIKRYYGARCRVQGMGHRAWSMGK